MLIRSARYAACCAVAALAFSPASAQEKVAKKAEPVQAQAAPAEAPLRAGGPDAFGYSFIDSNEPGGPTYDFIDISGTGTQLTAGPTSGGNVDDGHYTVGLPFTFPFYGQNYTTIYVSTNGHIDFNASRASNIYTAGNNELPQPAAPMPTLMLYGEDLDPGDRGDIYVQDLGDGRFVVQYEEVTFYPLGSAGAPQTFQAILNEDGSVLYQYETITFSSGDTNDVLIGLQNQDGTVGLEISDGDSYAQDGLAVLIGTGDLGGGDGPMLAGSLDYGTCPAALPEGRSRCFVDATGTFNGEQGQRYTVFLRVAETGRIAFRGEVKPAAGETIEQMIKFVTVASDPASFTLELVAEEGSVAGPSGDAEVIGTVSFTKGGPALRAAEGLTAYPNPATEAATLRFAVASPAEATLVVYDALGREVARPVEGTVTGVVEASLATADLPAGLYVARLVVDGRSETVRLSVVR